jgi:hypothetical protein
MPTPTSNFSFLAHHDSLLARLGGLAELYSVSDPNTALFKLRQFGEALLQRVAARAGIAAGADGSQLSLIRALSGQGVLPREVAELFHVLRQVGNEAVHGFGGTTGEVVHHLKVARELGVWFHRTFADPDFAPGAFVRPQPPADPAAELQTQREELRAERDLQRQRLEEAGLQTALEEELRREADRRARLAAEDREAALELAGMEELLAAERARLQAELSVVREHATGAADTVTDALRQRARAAAELMELDEKGTRELIDQQLRDAGWEADSETLRFAAGTRSDPNRNFAVAEWPTETGPANYVLFAGLTPVAVVEAKRAAVNVAGALEAAMARFPSPPPAATPTTAELTADYAASLEAGDTVAAQAARTQLARALAADTLRQTEARIEVLEARIDSLQAERPEPRFWHGPLAFLRAMAEDQGLGLGWSSLYFTAFLVLWQGQTPGKRLTGVRVLRLNGAPITWWMAFERFGDCAAGLTTGLLGFLQIYWDANRQAIHDKVAETVVVKSRVAATRPKPSGPAADAGSPHPTDVSGPSSSSR